MEQILKIDQFFMKRALRLAYRGVGKTSPNPMVGTVVVKNEEVVGQGYHKKYGGPHAEIYALDQAKEKTKGATLYVNLEPCSHFGNTPPCVDRVIKAGISRVVICNQDPNPLVSGGGVQKLEEAGINVQLSVLEEEGLRLNEAYFTFITQKRPFVILKWAQSLDGKIATKTKESAWISNEKSRKIAHQLRKEVDAVLVGAGTVIKDNPRLTVRHVKGRQPWRLVLDQNLEINLDVNLLNDDFYSKTVIFTSSENLVKIKEIQQKNIEVVSLKLEKNGFIDLSQITNWMAEKRMISLLVEGGSQVLTSFIKAGLGDKLMVFVAPKLFGTGIDAVCDLDVQKMDQIINLKNSKYKKLGSDILMEAYFKENHVYRTN